MNYAVQAGTRIEALAVRGVPRRPRNPKASYVTGAVITADGGRTAI